MALKTFGSKGGASPMDTRPGSAPAAAPAAGPGGLTAFIDQGSEFEGKLSFRDTVRIDGNFSGEITSENTLIVGESGQIEATIHSRMVVVSGSVTGDIHAGEKIVLHKTAQVSGNVETPCLVMEEGAVLNGQVRMESAGTPKAASGPLKAIDGGAPKEDAQKGANA